MASKQEPEFPLRLLVDKEKHRVVVAEASGDLIDILFSFLTLPLGTIIRLVSKNQLHDQPEEIGCINNLYKSVENFNAEVFWNNICKRMLLCPRNPCEDLCQKLKLKVDDSEPTKYFRCRSSCRWRNDWLLLNTFAGASCSSCGQLMDKEMNLLGDSNEETHCVFVEGGTKFLIFDDLKVLPNSPGNSVKQLLQLGYKNFNKLTEISANVGREEILELLKQALISKSPLSDVFLANAESKRMYNFSPKHGPESNRSIDNCINLKVTVTKSKKIVYAEAEGDFVDFICSFLTTPLGYILKLLNGNSSLGCMDNLYNSVNDLNPLWLTSPFGTSLLDLRVAPQFGYWRPPLKLREEDTPFEEEQLFEPRSPDGRRESAEGFVRRPSLFVVLDDLQVTPLANTYSISILQELNVPLDDLEEHVVSIGETEALNLLGASLTSKAALTEGLSYLLKKPKEEPKA